MHKNPNPNVLEVENGPAAENPSADRTERVVVALRQEVAASPAVGERVGVVVQETAA